MDFHNTARLIKNELSKYRFSFADVRVYCTSRTALDLDKTKLKKIMPVNASGFSVRILNSSFGLAGSSDFSKIREVVKKAYFLSRANGKKLLIEKPIIKDNILPKYKEPVNEIDLDRKIAFAKNSAKSMLNCKKIKTASVLYYDSAFEKFYFDSYGSEILEKGNVVAFAVEPFMKQGSRIEASYNSERFSSDFSALEENAPRIISTAVERLKHLIKSKPAPRGIFDVVLDPEVVGVFMHEAVGHCAEADLFLEDSVFCDLRGKLVAGKNITISDSSEFSQHSGSIKYDDEGIPKIKTNLIKNGKLVGLLHSLKTANKMGCKPTGNGRADAALSMPIPRMTITYLEPGSCTKEELVKECKNGLLTYGFRGGVVSPTKGTFQFGIALGQIIKNGRLGDYVSRMAISGTTLEVLRNIYLVGNDLKLKGGLCGKFMQYTPVSNGGPHTLVKKMRAG